MVSLDSIFSSLADPTRRDILRRVSQEELSVNEIAAPYDLTLAAISKHLKILEQAHLIVKHRRGKQLFVQLAPQAFNDAANYLYHYQQLLGRRYDALEEYLKEEQKRQRNLGPPG